MKLFAGNSSLARREGGVKEGGASVWAQFEIPAGAASFRSPALLPAGRGISHPEIHGQRDPSLRLKNGFAQEDKPFELRGQSPAFAGWRFHAIL